MNKGDFEKVVLGVLPENGSTGYEVFKTLVAKGIKAWPNHVYVTLAKMERAGLLTSRWVENPRGRGTKKHLYSLSKRGEDKYRKSVMESVQLLMGAFLRYNSGIEDLSYHVSGIRRSFEQGDVHFPPRNGGVIVDAIPRFDPLVCFPASIHALARAFPNASVYIVKDPELRFKSESPNLFFLDGSRHDLPLKDAFADCLLLEGIPKEVSVKETLAECVRVVKEGGNLRVMISDVMMEGKKPEYVSFPEFVSRLFYDMTLQDRSADIDQLRQLLSVDFREVREYRDYGNTVFWGLGRREEKQIGWQRGSRVAYSVARPRSR